MNVRAVCEGSFTLPLEPEAAVPLFTPEGERRWAGALWDPSYPVPGASADDSAPGTVFTTEGEGGDAVWIVTGRHGDGISYARVAPSRIAGTIEVTCTPGAEPGECCVAVRYDVTSLGPDGAGFVSELQTGFDEFLNGWRDEILAGLAAETNAAAQPSAA
jgi:hypothetical protein